MRRYYALGVVGPHRVWTDPDLQILRQLAGALPTPEIARTLGRTRSSIKEKARQLGLSLRAPKQVHCKRCGARFLSSSQARYDQVCPECRPSHNYEKSRRHESGPYYREALERAGYACERCGSGEVLCIHHRDGNGHRVPPARRNHEPANLEVLCRACHRKEHSERVGKDALRTWGRLGARAAGFCRRPWAESAGTPCA